MQDDVCSQVPEHRLLRLVFENACEAIAVVNDDGRLIMANRAARELRAFDPERFFAWRAERDPTLASLRAQLRVSGRGSVEVRVEGTPADGTRVLALEGRAHGPYYAISIRDVTELRRMERELEQLRKVQDVGVLAASVVHDFNNALTAILLAASALASDPSGARSAELASSVRDCAERAAERVRRVLAFLRRPPARSERVNLSAAVEELRALLAQTLGGRIDLALDLDGGDVDAWIEREQLDRLLVSLATSIRAAMPDGGRVTIATGGTPSGSHVELKVGMQLRGAVDGA